MFTPALMDSRFPRSISLATFFTSLSIFGWSDRLQILLRQAAFSFAVLCIIMFSSYSLLKFGEKNKLPAVYVLSDYVDQ